MSESAKAKCGGCGKEFKQNEGVGRPRKFCKTCRPPRAKK